jgi:hypothetical protein
MIEPGDATRYDFVMGNPFNNHIWKIMPWGSTFDFPQHIDYDIIINMNSDEKYQESIKMKCNPCTLDAVIEAIKRIQKKENIKQ